MLRIPEVLVMDEAVGLIILLGLFVCISISAGVCAGINDKSDEQRQQLIDSCTIEKYEPACRALEN